MTGAANFRAFRSCFEGRQKKYQGSAIEHGRSTRFDDVTGIGRSAVIVRTLVLSCELDETRPKVYFMA